MLPLSSLRNKWLPLGMEGSISESLKILLLAEWRRSVFVCFPVAMENFILAGTINYFAFPLDIFGACFIQSKTEVVVRSEIQPARWQDWFPKMSEGHLEKTSLSYQLWGESKQFLWTAYYTGPSPGRFMLLKLSWVEEQLLETFNWHGSWPACPQIGSISCLSIEKRTSHVFCCFFTEKLKMTVIFLQWL